MAGSAIVPTPASLTSRRHPHTCTLVQCQSPHDAAILRLHRLRIVPMLSLIGLVAALTLLVIVTVRGMSLFIATPICALLVALTSDIALFPQLAASGQSDLLTAYMDGFTSLIGSSEERRVGKEGVRTGRY